MIVVNDNWQAQVDDGTSKNLERFDEKLETWVPWKDGVMLKPGAYRTDGQVQLVAGSAMIWDPENPPPPPAPAPHFVGGKLIPLDVGFVHAGLGMGMTKK
jgi:hypothetical protein